jgi:hypothetical protein
MLRMDAQPVQIVYGDAATSDVRLLRVPELSPNIGPER